LLIYVVPRQDTLLGIVVGLIWGLGQDTLLGIVVGLCASGNTLLGIAVGLCGTSGNTLYWVLLWVMRRFGQHTVLGIIRSDEGCLHQWVQNNPF
jgi:hypothetical protein